MQSNHAHRRGVAISYAMRMQICHFVQFTRQGNSAAKQSKQVWDHADHFYHNN